MGAPWVPEEGHLTQSRAGSRPDVVGRGQACWVERTASAKTSRQDTAWGEREPLSAKGESSG